MKFPFVSFLMAIAIWSFFIVILFCFQNLETNNEIGLEVEASMVDDISRLSSNKNNLHKDLKQNTKNTELKSQENELLPSEEHLAKLKESEFLSEEKNSANSDVSKANKAATIAARVLPEIPEDLRQEAFDSYAIARFHIAADGSFVVELVKPCNNPRLNKLLLQSLRKWKFVSARSAGAPIASIRDIKVNFRVE